MSRDCSLHPHQRRSRDRIKSHQVARRPCRPGRGFRIALDDRPRCAVGRRMADLVDGLGLAGREDTRCFRQRFAAGRQAENGVAVEHGVGRPDGPGQAVVGHLRHLERLGLGEDGIGCHDTDGGVAGRPAGRLGRQFHRAPPRIPELAGEFKPDLPGPAGRRVDHRPVGIHGHQGGDGEARIEELAGRPQPALDAVSQRAGPGPAAAQDDGAGGRCVAGAAAPIGPDRRHELRAAAKIVEYCRRDDRGHLPPAQRETQTPFGQPADHPVGRGQAVHRTAGQDHGLHLFHQVHRREQVGFTRARGGSAHIHRAGCARRAENDRDAADGGRVRVVADQDPLDIRQSIKRSGSRHFYLSLEAGCGAIPSFSPFDKGG